ncbi:hypothetical protein EGW08_009140 [Elysia chlorotica]|uniref:F-box domain-containing protein n=1 Tax=Elysia chlorotica TaxID=188477 RepID=A0A3S1B9Q9_ELYCH|nr:hypothetical protein EGW08_009140 [Elysia chlorotica]
MDCLPDEVLLRIFSELTLVDLICGARQVCWRWFHISMDASLWKHVDFSEVPSYCETDRDLKEIHQGMRSLLLSVQSSLESLTFGSSCHDGGIFELFGSSWKHVNKARFPSLKCLDYSYSYASPRNLRVAITTHCDIEELYLCHTRISFYEAMKEALHLSNLKVLVFMDSSVCLNHDVPLVKVQLMRVPKVCTKLEHVKLLTIQADLDDEVIQQFTKHCPNLKSLSLTCSATLSPDAFTFIKPPTSCIKSLEFRDRNSTKPYLYFVLPWFPHLTHLDVTGQCVALEDCKAIADCCPNLHELIFRTISSTRGDNMPEGIFDRFLNNTNTKPLCGLELITIAEKCKKLRKLYAAYSDIDDESVVFLTQRCPDLEEVDFSECIWLTKISLLALSKNSPNLRKLHFQENKVNHLHIMNCLLRCRKLHEVFFDGIAIKPSQETFQETRIESVSESRSVDSFKTMDDIPYIDMTTSTEDKELQDLLLFEFDTNVTNAMDVKSTLAKSDQSLLPGTDCSSFSQEPEAPVIVTNFFNHCPVKRLSLASSLAEEKFLIALVRECPSLTLLELKGTEALTDDLVVTIAKNCPNLETLGLSLSVYQSSDSKFGDRGLMALISYSRQLECLSFMNNRNITSGAVQMLFLALETTLPRLQSVSLSLGQGYACSSSVIALHGMKYMTESSKKQLKSSATNNKSSFFIHLDFKKRKLGSCNSMSDAKLKTA